MPHSRSAAKRVRQNEKNRVANKRTRTAMRTQEQRVRDLIAAGNADESRAALSIAFQRFDKAAKAGVIHRNTASNHKRKLAARIAKIGGSARGAGSGGARGR
jgi:small subunit ribosomal protein S20